MAYQCLLGTSQTFDAVAYARGLTEDDTAPFTVSDTRYANMVEVVAEDFSRYNPLDYQVGNPILGTSSLVTVVNQFIYVCNSANGFTVPPLFIRNVLYQATSAFTSGSEISYLALLPISPLNRFLFTPSLLDAPSERILRDEYLSELDHYGKGYYTFQRDPATGLMAIWIYPYPQTAGLPIYVQYQGGHADSGAGSHPNPANNSKYVTVPEDLKRDFGQLLYAQVLEEEGDRLAKALSAKSGMIDVKAGDPRLMEEKIVRVRQEVYARMGGNVPVAIHTF